MEDIKRFFRPVDSTMDIADCDYAKTKTCIAMANALARNTNCSLYIIDYNRKNFFYVSSNPLFLCGHSPEDVQEKGYAFYFDVVPSDEINRLMAINEAGFRFYYDQPVEKRLDLSIEYNFHIRTSEKHSHLIHHKLTPVLLSNKGVSGWLYVQFLFLRRKTSEKSSFQTIPVLTATSIHSREGDGKNSRS